MTTFLLYIISVTKDDIEGIKNTIESTSCLRNRSSVRHIVIDSSSVEISYFIKELACSNENVDYYWQEPSGISAAFNKGLILAESKWVWFLNGGDEVHSLLDSDKLLYLLNESGADAIIFQNEWSGTGNCASHPPMWAMWPPLRAWIPHPSTLTRKSLYEKYGNFNESFDIAMDYEFWIRCFGKETVVDTISIPITEYDNTGISSTQSLKLSQEAIRAIKLHLWMIIKMWFRNGILILRAWRDFSR